MPHKKKLFNKGNSMKFLLLRGSSQAVNADGETLQNVLVPVSKNYKPGSSLLMSNIAALSNINPEDIEEVENIEGVFDDASTVDDPNEAEEIVGDLLSDMKKLRFSTIPKEFDTFDDCDYVSDVKDRKNSKQGDPTNYRNCSEKWKMFSEKFSDDDDEDDVEDSKYSEQKQPRNYENCSENWKMFNEKFDKILEEYTDDKIGALDDDDDVCFMKRASPEPFIQDIEDDPKELDLVLGDCDETLKEKILNYAEDDGDEKIVEIVTEKPLEFDCESILSTYSNIYNHPTVIKEEKTQRIRNTSHTSHSETESEFHSNLLTNMSNVRKKGETPEERKERQKKFKEAKKLRRELKKQNKEAFKEEKKFQSLTDQQNASMKLL